MQEADNNNAGRPECSTLDELAEVAMNELQIKTAAHDNLWGLGEAAWEIDQEQGTIVFTSEEKGMVATCKVQIIATYNTEDGTWLWGWDHPSVEPPLNEHAEIAHQFGLKDKEFEVLTVPKIGIEESFAWELAAITCHLAGADGVYRGPAGSTMVFVTYSEVTLTKLG